MTGGGRSRAVVLRGDRVVLRPLTGEDIEAVAAIVHEPSVRQWWPVPDEGTLREELGDDDCLAWTIRVDDEIAGWIQACEEEWPGHRSAGIDIVLGAAHQDRGLGTDALRAVIGFLLRDRGHRRLTIDPAADNARAIRVYEKVGFRPIGIARAYERREDGTERDALLMDLLAGEEA